MTCQSHYHRVKIFGQKEGTSIFVSVAKLLRLSIYPILFNHVLSERKMDPTDH